MLSARCTLRSLRYGARTLVPTANPQLRGGHPVPRPSMKQPLPTPGPSFLFTPSLRSLQSTCRARCAANARFLSRKGFSADTRAQEGLYQSFQHSSVGHATMRWAGRTKLRGLGGGRHSPGSCGKTGARSISYVPRYSPFGENTVLYILCGVSLRMLRPRFGSHPRTSLMTDGCRPPPT